MLVDSKKTVAMVAKNVMWPRRDWGYVGKLRVGLHTVNLAFWRVNFLAGHKQQLFAKIAMLLAWWITFTVNTFWMITR